MNKKAWVKVVEAFIAVLILVGLILLIISKTNPRIYDLSHRIYDTQLSILSEIEHNTNLREDIVEYSGPLPVKWNDFDARGFSDLKDKIIQRTPSYLECEAKICAFDDSCESEYIEKENVYAKSIGIFAESGTYSPKQLKLFCWTK